MHPSIAKPTPSSGTSAGAAMASRGGAGLLLGAVVLAVLLALDLRVDAEQPPPAEAFPSLAELEKVRWTRRSCVDFLEHLRSATETSAGETSEAEALRLPDSDPASNRRILDVFGRQPRNGEEVDWDATFFRQIGGEPRTLNPIFSSSRYEFWLEELLFVGPIQFDWNLEFHGDLNVIESWETSEDRLMDRVVFRDDLVWSDGVPFTSGDVEFTWSLLTNPSIRSPARESLLDGLRGVKAYDRKTVVYFQRRPLVTNSLHFSWAVLPRHAFTKALIADPTLQNCSLNRAPVTCGPYRLVRWNPGEDIVLERRDEWYLNDRGEKIRPKPYFKSVRFRVLPQNSGRFFALLAGEIDEGPLDSAQWTKESADPRFLDRCVKVRGDDEWTYAYIGWNARSSPPNPFFGDSRVRLAMTLALEHDFLLKQVFFGIYRPGQGIFHPDSWMAAKELQPFHRDVARAEKLLEEAGWTDSDGDGVRDKKMDGRVVPFRFTLSCPNAGTGPRVAEQLQADLKGIGVECDIRLVEWVTFTRALTERKLDAYLMSMGTGVDPDTARNLWHSESIEKGRNDVGYSNPRVDELLDRGRLELDRAKRAEIYAEVDRLIYRDQPITILLYQPTLWAFSKALRGYHPSPKGFYGYAPGFFAIWKKK